MPADEIFVVVLVLICVGAVVSLKLHSRRQERAPGHARAERIADSEEAAEPSTTDPPPAVPNRRRKRRRR